MASEGPSPAHRWGFLGSGKMATSLALGMLRAEVARPEDIRSSDASEAARVAFGQATGAATLASNRDLVRACDVLILAVKPQVVPHVLDEVQPEVGPGHLVISIAAGAPLGALASHLGPDCRLVRVMPNTPALIGMGASGYTLGQNTTHQDAELVQACLNSVGRAYAVPEPLLDAVTGLSGSGPAFVYAIIEALSDGGVRVGLPREIATALAAQTVLGAAAMVLETGLHTGTLKDQVTSPGGTTIAGLHALERGGLRAALMDAVQAATRRAGELAAHSRPGE